MENKMKISILFVLLLTAAVISAGCIGGAPQENMSDGSLSEGNKPEGNASPEALNLTYGPLLNTGYWISCGQSGDDIICTVFFNNTYENAPVTYSKSGDNILINLPVEEKNASSDTKPPAGYMISPKYNISINIGKRDSFDNGTFYSVFINNNTEKSGLLYFENNSLMHTFTPLQYVGELQLTADGRKIKANLRGIQIADRAYKIDIDNAAVLKADNEVNTFIISIPLRSTYKDGDVNATTESIPYTFDIADAQDLRDGTYKVKINDQEASFLVRDHNVARIFNPDSS